MSGAHPRQAGLRGCSAGQWPWRGRRPLPAARGPCRARRSRCARRARGRACSSTCSLCAVTAAWMLGMYTLNPALAAAQAACGLHRRAAGAHRASSLTGAGGSGSSSSWSSATTRVTAAAGRGRCSGRAPSRRSARSRRRTATTAPADPAPDDPPRRPRHRPAAHTCLRVAAARARTAGRAASASRSPNSGEANRRLEATIAENEGLHRQLLTQAREAGVLDERRRMAREIHDTLAQGLTGIVTQLQAAEQAAVAHSR